MGCWFFPCLEKVTKKSSLCLENVKWKTKNYFQNETFLEFLQKFQIFPKYFFNCAIWKRKNWQDILGALRWKITFASWFLEINKIFIFSKKCSTKKVVCLFQKLEKLQPNRKFQGKHFPCRCKTENYENHDLCPLFSEATKGVLQTLPLSIATSRHGLISSTLGWHNFTEKILIFKIQNLPPKWAARDWDRLGS